MLRHALGGDWELVEPSAGYVGAGRGIGLVDVARSADRRTATASGELGLHVLDAMESITQSATDGTRHRIGSRCTRPAPVPLTRF